MPALPIAAVVAAVLTQLKDIPALASRFETIIAYDSLEPQTQTRAEAIVEMVQPAAMVTCTAAGQSMRGGLPAWRYGLVIDLRLEGTAAYQSFFTELLNGVPSSGDGLTWMDTSPLPIDLDPPEAVAYTERRDSSGEEYWEFAFALTATGG